MKNIITRALLLALISATLSATGAEIPYDAAQSVRAVIDTGSNPESYGHGRARFFKPNADSGWQLQRVIGADTWQNVGDVLVSDDEYITVPPNFSVQTEFRWVRVVGDQLEKTANFVVPTKLSAPTTFKVNGAWVTRVAVIGYELGGWKIQHTSDLVRWTEVKEPLQNDGTYFTLPDGFESRQRFYRLAKL